MKSLRIQNLKSIKDSGNIDIKPLTILIGRNSSGKSSFVRSLPLLKQSAMKKLSSPILWYGEYVEFEVSGDKIEAVYMIPGWTHNIINLSKTENLVTVMTCNEVFNKDMPDTFFEIVKK